MARPSRVNFTTGTISGIDREVTTSLTVTKPTTVTEGNLLLMQVVASGATNTISTPSGWTQIANVLNSTCRQAIFRKYAGASEGNATVTVGSGAGSAVGAMIQVQDMHLTDPIDVFSSSTGNSTSPSAPGVTASGGDRRAFHFVGISYEDFTQIFTNLYDGSAGGGFPDAILGAQDETIEDGPTISANSFTTLDFAERWIGTTVVVQGVDSPQIGDIGISMGAAF